MSISRSVRKAYLRASYHIYKIGCLLVRSISLPAAQLFVIAVENILRVCGGGNLTRRNEQVDKRTNGQLCVGTDRLFVCLSISSKKLYNGLGG